MSNEFLRASDIKIDALINQINTDAVVSDVATKWGMGGGTVATFYGWITSSAAAILIGIVVTVGGFVVNYYFQRKRHQKEMEFNELRTQLLLKDEQRKQEMHELELQERKHKL